MDTPKTIPKPRFCSIQSCLNSKGTTNEHFYFFRPTKKKDILDKWKEAISQHQPVENIHTQYVCNLHFEAKSMIQMNGRLLLKCDSVPSIFCKNSQQKSEVRKGEMVVNPKQIRIVNIDRIMENVSPLKNKSTEISQNKRLDKVGSAMCKGCIERDVKNKELLATTDKLKIALEQERHLARHWKSLAIQYMPEDQIPATPRIGKHSQSTKAVFKSRVETIVIPAELIKVEGKPSEDNISPEPVTATTEISDDIKFDISVNKPSNPVLNSYPKPYKCGNCYEAFEKPKELQNHMHIHKHDGQIKIPSVCKFECYICKEDFRSLLNLHKHMKVHRKKYRLCVVCRERYEKCRINQHLCTLEHSIICEYCSQAYSSTNRLLDHLKSAHTERNMYRCLKCPKLFGMIVLKNIHERSHDIINPFPCNICSKSYMKPDSLQRHQKRDHQENQENFESSHLCDQCGKEFRTQNLLRAHMQRHEEPKYKCPSCPALFHTKIYLYKHSYIHRNIKYVCSVCGAELSSPMGLRRHINRQHSSITEYFECKICEKKFKSKKTLKKHRTVHVTSRDFLCTFCGSSYKYSGDLNKHLKIHLGDKIYECKEEGCSERFRLPIELTKHSFKHYEEQQTGIKITT